MNGFGDPCSPSCVTRPALPCEREPARRDHPPSETSWRSGERGLPLVSPGDHCEPGAGHPGGNMATTQDDIIAELQRANAELRRERDAALAREVTLAGELAVSTAA